MRNKLAKFNSLVALQMFKKVKNGLSFHEEDRSNMGQKSTPIVFRLSSSFTITLFFLGFDLIITP